MIVSSMTGWGSASCACEGGEVTAELRAVNSRFLELTVRSEPAFPETEARIRSIIKDGVYRGKVSVMLTFSPNKKKGIPSVEVDGPLLEAYLSALKHVHRHGGIRSRKPSLKELLMLTPFWLRVSSWKLPEDIFGPAAEKAAAEAMLRLIEMRRIEGSRLAEDLDKRLSFLEEQHRYLTDRQDSVAAEYEARLRRRIESCLAEIGAVPDDARLLQEVALYAERTDFTEEMTRLGSHLSQFRSILSKGGPVGRKLDFLIQEMNREINTCASKTNSLDIVNCVIMMKTELEKIREQVQNLE